MHKNIKKTLETIWVFSLHYEQTHWPTLLILCHLVYQQVGFLSKRSQSQQADPNRLYSPPESIEAVIQKLEDDVKEFLCPIE